MVFRAKDVVETEFLSLQRDASAFEAAKIMNERKHGFVVIVKPDGAPEGIVTEWDYLSKLVAMGKDPVKTKLGDLMSTDLVTVDSEEAFDRISQMMAEKGIRRVLVMKDHKVVGVVTAKTILARLQEYVNRVSAQIARLQSPPY